MKSFISILSVILVMLLCSCSSTNMKSSTKPVIIAGKVVNPDPLINKLKLSINKIGVGNEVISSTLDKDGNFKVIFESYIPLDAWLSYKTSFLVLTHPGDSIYLEFDGSEEARSITLESVSFSGDASKINTEAAAFQRILFSTKNLDYYLSNQNAMKIYNANDYKRYRDSIKNTEDNLLSKFLAEYNPVSELKIWAQTYINVEFYSDLIAYPQMHRLENNLTKQEWNVPISYYEFIKNHFQVNVSSLVSSNALSSFVNMYPVYLHERMRYDNSKLFNTSGYFKKHPEVMDSLRFYSTLDYIDDPLLEQMVLTEILYQSLETSNTKIFNRYKSKISEIITEPYLREPLFDLYNQTIKNFDNPKQASNTILKKLDGYNVEAEIKEIIAINDGKVIYMDCWATWCGPCIAEFQNSKELMKEYKTDQVAFIFICLDSEEKNWKATLSKHSLGGQHYFLTKDQSSEFRNAFNIRGVPHYILFDTNGNISQNQTNSPGFIKEKIDQLLTNK